jgi:hypothetical protein
MKKILLGAAAAIAIAAPSVAFADSAQVGVHIGNIEPDGASDVDYWGIDGAYSHDTNNGWTLQMDGSHENIDVGGDLGISYGSVSFGKRNDHHALYGFVGLSDVSSLSFTNIGIGGQLYLGNATINASLGHASGDTGGGDVEVTGLHVDGTYFFTDNLGVSAEAGWSEADLLGTEVDGDTLGVGGVYRFNSSPFSVNANYRNVDNDGFELDVWQIGFTYNIGTGSEREHSQSGSSWNGGENLFQNTFYSIL